MFYMKFLMSYNYEFLNIVEKTKVPETYTVVTIIIKFVKLLEHKRLSDLK